jgi:hypothetical protein
MAIRVNKPNLVKLFACIFLVIFIFKLVNFLQSDQEKIAKSRQIARKKAYENQTFPSQREDFSVTLANDSIEFLNKSSITYETKYALKINTARLNRLFDILLEKERVFEEIFQDLSVISFRKLVDGRADSDETLSKFNQERERFLQVDNGKVTATEDFISYLKEMSNKHSFVNPRNYVTKSKIIEVLSIFFSNLFLYNYSSF